jgi:hypothetical protein
MGLFGKLLGREGAKAPEAAEAPKAEATEIKSAKETGKERVDKMLAASRDTKNAVMTSTGNVLKRAGGALLDAVFASLGGVEKGGKATAKFAGETKQEAGELARRGVEAGNRMDADVWAFLKGSAVAGVDKLNGFAEWIVQSEKELKEKVPSVHEDLLRHATTARTNAEIRVMDMVNSGLKNLDALGNWGVAASNEFAQKRGEVHADILARVETRLIPAAQAIERFVGNVINVPRDAGREYNNLTAQAGAATDRFVGWANETRLKAAGAAELKGEAAALREQVDRLTKMVEANKALTAVVAEQPTSGGIFTGTGDSRPYTTRSDEVVNITGVGGEDTADENPTLIPRGDTEEFVEDEVTVGNEETVKTVQG